MTSISEKHHHVKPVVKLIGKLKVKKLVPEAVLPFKAKDNDSGYDVVAISDPEITEDYVQYRTGLAVELPNLPPDSCYDIQLRARSSISKYDLVLCNGIGTIDNGYRGELVVRFKVVPMPRLLRYDGNSYIIDNLTLVNGSYVAKTEPTLLKLYKKGDKVAQIVIGKVYDLEVEEVTELSNTERGSGGFGSSGK